MQSKLFLFLCLGVSGFTGLPAHAEKGCSKCLVKFAALEKFKQEKKTNEDLLKKNQDYLATVGSNETSKLIKLNSNINLIHIKLGAAEKNISALDSEINKDCKACNPAKERLNQ